jgi:hypothetical protein
MGTAIEMPTGSSTRRRKSKRGCCGVDWRSVAKHQTYGALLVLVIAAVVTGVSHFFKEPDVRPLPAFDPTISLPYAAKDTVPMAEAAGEKLQLQCCWAHTAARILGHCLIDAWDYALNNAGCFSICGA